MTRLRKAVLSTIALSMLCSFALTGCGHEHVFGEWQDTTPATCTAGGEQERKCEKCDEVETQETEATGHSFGEWVITKEVTCTEDGMQERECSVCGEKENEVIASTGHEFEEATLFAPKTCTVCGETEGEALATPIKVGEKVSCDDHSFKVAETYYTKKVSEKRGNHTTSIGTEGNYFVLKLNFTNLKSEALDNHDTTRISDIKLVYQDTYEYEGNYRLLIAREIVPLATENLFIYFDVPEGLKDDKKSSLYASFKIDDVDYAMILQKGKKAKAAKADTSSDKEEEQPKKEVESSLKKGETKTDDTNFSFKVSDIYYAKKVSEKRGNHTSSIGTEGNYLICKLSFTNLMTTALDNYSDRISNIKLSYDGKYDYEGEYRILIDNEIVPLATGNVYIYFAVPADLEKKEGSLLASFDVDGSHFEMNCR